MSDPHSPSEEPLFELEALPQARERVEDGIALCLSGGGYRAMLFHVGALWRLNEMGLLRRLRRISSVSGGSITAATLGLHWGELDFQNDTAANFAPSVADPIRELASQTLDVHSVGWGILNPFSTIADHIAAAYDEHLFSGATLQDLPDDDSGPRFVINATNVKTGAVWRFSRPYMGDWRTGLVRDPSVLLATAVAASSAFPPFLSPLTLDVDPDAYDPETPAEFDSPEFRASIILTDGGVYDNLGLETAFKRYGTILVSDGGRAMAPEPDPAKDWARHSYRLIELLQHQTSNLRRRQIVSKFISGERARRYWGIQTDIADYQLADALPAPHDRTLEIAGIPTRLAALDAEDQQRIINWGYAVSDAAIRKHFPQGEALTPLWPYPPQAV